MKKLKVITVVLGLLMLLVSFASSASAASWPSLPTTSVNVTVVDGVNSYFIATFSGISPDTFDVKNGVPYPGWCIDDTKGMARGVPHVVMLYSSLDSSLPDNLGVIDWNAINYILNHKIGSMMDVQMAIWYFAAAFHGGMPLPVGYPNAVTMINLALANTQPPPAPGDILAIICYGTEPDYQNFIIELVMPPEQGPGLTPGFWKHNVGVYLTSISYDDVEVNGAYSDPTGATEVTKETMGTWLAAGWTDAELYDLWLDLSYKGGGAAGAEIRNNAANVFNVAAGLSPGPPWV